jgi:enoyl-CoA hydratase/carnithine racemase
MLLTGEPINAQEALQFGFINRISSKQDLEKETEKLIDSILNNSSNIVSFGKEIYQKQIEMNEEDALKFAMDAMMKNLEMEDSKEGMNAFKEKRKPKWN